MPHFVTIEQKAGAGYIPVTYPTGIAPGSPIRLVAHWSGAPPYSTARFIWFVPRGQQVAVGSAKFGLSGVAFLSVDAPPAGAYLVDAEVSEAGIFANKHWALNVGRMNIIVGAAPPQTQVASAGETIGKEIGKVAPGLTKGLLPIAAILVLGIILIGRMK